MTVRIGIVGLGRLGKQHGKNLAFKVHGAELVCACSIVAEELDFAKQVLGVHTVFGDYAQMLCEMQGKMDAVFLVTSTNGHADQIIAGLQSGYHVFCEKPLALQVADCERVEAICAKYPDKVCLIGFVRRYDASYYDAKQRIDRGQIGTPVMVRSQSGDMDAWAEFQIAFCETSGGIFLDCSIHDIDLCRWLLGTEFAQLYAIGGAYAHKGFEAVQDGNNVSVMAKMANGTMSYICATRTQWHGHATHTEIIGTKGTLQVGMNPHKNRLSILDTHGVRNECVQTFYERFEQAFLSEAQDFVDCIKNRTKPRVSLADATAATRTAIAMTQSYRAKTLVDLD